nr:ABC transporter ATP-binding protein [bacterium]
MESIIRTEGVSRTFKSGRDTIYALRDVTIEIPRGKLTILRGRSGSGKTTLMNLLGALDLPNAGHIFFGDQEINLLPEPKRDELRRKQIGFIFQSVALIGLMSARENVEFALRVAEAKDIDRTKRAEECLTFVGLHKRMDHRPQELSGGEQQRVAIARAIAHRPTVLFADEPTAELDTHMGLQVLSVFRDLVVNEGVTIVMTTHDPNMVELADCVYTLEDGQIVDHQVNDLTAFDAERAAKREEQA